MIRVIVIPKYILQNIIDKRNWQEPPKIIKNYIQEEIKEPIVKAGEGSGYLRTN